MNHKIKKVFCFVAAAMLFAGVSQAGELFVWTDKHGKQHITDTEPPPSAKGKIERVGFRRSSPGEIRAWQNYENQRLSSRVAADERRNAIGHAYDARAEEARSAQAEIQAARDSRANRLRDVVGAVSDSGALGKYRDTIETMARNKEAQIRSGTDRPMSQSEDTRYHIREAVDQKIMEERIIHGDWRK